MLRNLKYKRLQEWTLLLKIKNKKINFHIFFLSFIALKNVPICRIDAIPLNELLKFTELLKIMINYSISRELCLFCNFLKNHIFDNDKINRNVKRQRTVR